MVVAAKRGFTMVELMVVVAIIGLITTAVTMSIESLLPGERLNSSIRTLAASLMDARSQAISHSLEYRVIYDLEHHRYRMSTPFKVGGGRLDTELDEDYDRDDRWYTEWTYLEDGVQFSHVVVAGEVYDSGFGEVYVAFDPLGGASDHSVALTQPLFENLFTIEVLPLTGLIRMHEGYFVREEPQDGDFN
jgi:type II secretion system protein H